MRSAANPAETFQITRLVTTLPSRNSEIINTPGLEKYLLKF